MLHLSGGRGFEKAGSKAVESSGAHGAKMDGGSSKGDLTEWVGVLI